MTKYRKQLEISIPDSYDLGFCTVNQRSQFSFTIFNPNLKPISYNFKFTKFIVTPSKGVLMPNSIANFKIQFKPQQAAVIVGTIIMDIQGQESRVFKISGVGKYPYIAVNSQQIDFGDVLVTKVATKQIILKNSSDVVACFNIVPVLQNNNLSQQFNDIFFSFNPNRGQIPPHLTYSVKVIYNPQFTDTPSISKFRMICQNGNSIDINCKGNSQKFNISLSTTSLNFGQIKLGTISSRILTLINNSQQQSSYQFYTDSGNIFNLNQTKGIIPRNSYKKIIIEFHPQNTISYYQRIYCLIRNHILSYVDLIGTCYDLLIKPIPLLQQHVDIFRRRVIQGRISQIQLKYIQNNLLLKLNKKIQNNNQETNHNITQQNFYTQLAINTPQYPYILHKQLFLEGYKNQLISISQDNIQFGYCQIMTISGQKQIEIINKLQTKLTLFWIPQKRQNLNGQYMNVFNIFPQTATLKTNVPVKFQLTFRPLKSQNYYFQYLQFYAIKNNPKITKRLVQDFQYKQMKAKPQTTLLRNVKLSQTVQSKVKQDIQTTQVFPPLTGVIRCVGHSFPPSSMPFLPIMKINPSKKVIFKPCIRNYSVYDSVELINQSDTPIYYKFSQDVNKVFKVYPKIGLIEPKSFCIVTLQFSPKEYKNYVSNLSIYLNDMQAGSPKLTLVGVCTPPQLKLQNQSKIFFAPTFTGVYTKKQYQIQNLTKNSINYKIKVPQKYKDQLHFQPSQKILSYNQSFKINVYFTPLAKRSYKIKVPILAYQIPSEYNLNIGYHNPGSGRKQGQIINNKQLMEYKQFMLEVIGQGSDGSLKFLEQQIDFNVVKITQQKKISIKIKNTSQCAFFLDLSLKNNDFQISNPPTDLQINNAFNLDFKQGIIPGNSQIAIGIYFNPIEVLKFNLKLMVNARQRVPKKISSITSKGIQPTIKCQLKIKAQGNYPLLQILDIRNDLLSVTSLWQNFQIQKINQQLSNKLNIYQKQYLNIQNLTFNQTKKLQNQLKKYQWNLGYVSTKIKTKPRKIIITVRNYGGTPLDYSFKFPSDNKIQEQLWADPGQPTPQQAYQKAILQKKIFQINPKVGHLQPNQIKDIELLYSPTSLDLQKNAGNSQVHLLKVVFQISIGKSLVFQLKGTTLGPNQGLITLKKTHYVLPQTPIGLLTPLRFPIQLKNVGSIKVTYKTEIQYQPDQFPQVFKIQNSNNFLLSGQNYYLSCLYKPLILKQYNFKIYLYVYDFSKLIQKIQLNLIGNPYRNNLKIPIQSEILKNINGQRTTVSQFGSKVFFSIQQIDFGVMKPCQTKYRMIILYNMSKQNALNYQFPSQNVSNSNKFGLTCGDKFIIQPSSGVLEPQNFIQLKLTLTSTKSPSVYQGQVPCAITWSYPKYQINQNDATQQDTSLLTQKQTLFLRLKKSSSFNDRQLNKFKDRTLKSNTFDKKSILDTIFDNIINNTLNQIDLQESILKLGSEKVTVLDLIDDSNPVSISKLQQVIDQKQYVEQKKDYSNHQYLFLNEQFTDLTQLILENTFFNIIQETTHKQNDFLRVAKKFIQADKI